MTQNFRHKETLQEIFDYCDNSANPVGELILRLSDNFNEKNLELSNKICTGLQLANFWQDFSRDLPNGRLYIPKNIFDQNMDFQKKIF